MKFPEPSDSAKSTVRERYAERVFRYLKRLPKEFEVCAVRDIARLKPIVQSTRAFVDWATRNAEVLL